MQGKITRICYWKGDKKVKISNKLCFNGLDSLMGGFPELDSLVG